MCRKCGSIAEPISEKNIAKTLFGGIVSKFSLKALAEEPSGDDNTSGEDDPDNSSKSTINYEDLISKARKEEKEKQYKAIEKLKGQVNTLTQQHNDDLLVVAGLKADLEKANAKLSTAGDGDTEAVKTLKGEVSTLTKEKKDLEVKVAEYEANKPVSKEEVEKEVRAELEAEYEVRTYKAEKMAELKDDILVPELVMGDTKEAIDATITQALERSKQIRENLGLADGGKKKPEKRTPKSVSNPSVTSVQDNQYSYEYLASLDVSSPEYAEVRKQLGLK